MSCRPEIYEITLAISRKDLAEADIFTNKIEVWSKDKEEKPWDFRKWTYPNK